MNQTAEIQDGEIVSDFPLVPTVETPRPTLVEVFKPNGLEKILTEIENKVRHTPANVSTKKGRDAVKSLAYEVAKSKTAIDNAGKSLTESQRREIDEVNAERKRAWDRLEKLQKDARKPLDDWEAADKIRVGALQLRLQAFKVDHAWAKMTSAELIEIKNGLAEIPMDETWEEFLLPAGIAQTTALESLMPLIEAALDREEREAEIARLKAEAEVRDKKDREEREAREAATAEENRILREQKAAQDAELEGLRKAAAEREAKDAADKKAAADRAEADRRAEEKRLADEKAAEEKRIQDEAAAAERETQRLAEIERAKEEAAAAERARLAEQQAAEEAEKATRKADAERREMVRTDIIRALEDLARTGSIPDLADAMMADRVPHVTVSY